MEFFKAITGGSSAIPPVRRAPTKSRLSGTKGRRLKEALAEVTLENRLPKKSAIADGEYGE